MPEDILKLLKGGDLRSIGKVDSVVARVRDQRSFDALFAGLWHDDRLVVMRAADAVEKITVKHPNFLQSHAEELWARMNDAEHKELKWHLAQLMPRIEWSRADALVICGKLKAWALDEGGSKIVRVSALQALHDIAQQIPALKSHFEATMVEMEIDAAPSIRARIRILKSGDQLSR